MNEDIKTSEDTLNNLSEAELADFRKEVREIIEGHSHAFLPLENLLGLTTGFVKELIDEKDDWAFIIKLAVILEATLGKVINAFLQNPLIEKHIRALPMDGRTGKIQLARDLGIIGPKSMTRLRTIVEIRNDFAHNLGVVQLSMGGYFSRLTNADASALYEKFFGLDRVEKPYKVKQEQTEEMDATDAATSKLLVYSCVWLALSELAAAYRRISSESSWRAALVVLGEAFLFRTKGDEKSAREKMRVAIDTLQKIAELHPSTVQKSVGETGAQPAV